MICNLSGRRFPVDLLPFVTISTTPARSQRLGAGDLQTGWKGLRGCEQRLACCDRLQAPAARRCVRPKSGSFSSLNSPVACLTRLAANAWSRSRDGVRSVHNLWLKSASLALCLVSAMAGTTRCSGRGARAAYRYSGSGRLVALLEQWPQRVCAGRHRGSFAHRSGLGTGPVRGNCACAVFEVKTQHIGV